MRAEPIFRNAVSVIAATFVPRAMLTSPIMCALPLPDILPYIARPGLGPSYLTHLPRGISSVHLTLGTPLVGVTLMVFARLLVPFLGPVFLMPAVLR
jgi:hypothetical protein